MTPKKREVSMIRRLSLPNSVVEQTELGCEIDGRIGEHGCIDSAGLKLLENGHYEVLWVHSCHNCWQVGHDQDHKFLGLAAGDVIELEVL